MYFDDLTVQDLGSMKESAQHFITSLATQMGSPFQPEKHQAMQSQSDFLGLVHDVSQCYRECILVNLYGFGRVTGF